jgi:hypothetical protein
MNKQLTLAVAAAGSVLMLSTQSALADTVISNIGIPAPPDGSTAPLAGGTATIGSGAGGQEKAFGFTVPASGPAYSFQSATLWLVGYDGDSANPPEEPIIKITQGSVNGPSLGSLTPVIKDPITNPPGNNDPNFFEFTGATPTLQRGETYFVTLSNSSTSGFNWARAASGGTAQVANPFTSEGYVFRDAGSGGAFRPSNELSGIAINAIPDDINAIPEPMTILGSVFVLGFGAQMRKKFPKK